MFQFREMLHAVLMLYKRILQFNNKKIFIDAFACQNSEISIKHSYYCIARMVCLRQYDYGNISVNWRIKKAGNRLLVLLVIIRWRKCKHCKTRHTTSHYLVELCHFFPVTELMFPPAGSLFYITHQRLYVSC